MKKDNKNRNWEIFCLLLIIISLFFAGRNCYKLWRLEKYGIIETVVIKSYSVKTRSRRSGTYYDVKMEYSLLGENESQFCSFDFKPAKEYYENERIKIVRDYKNDFKLPVNEKKSFKRVKIIGKLLSAVEILLILLLTRFIEYRFEKNRNRNKKIKKLAKKNPELKEKYKKQEKAKSTIFLILLAPILAVEYFFDKIKSRSKSKKKKN